MMGEEEDSFERQALSSVSCMRFLCSSSKRDRLLYTKRYLILGLDLKDSVRSR